MVDWMQETDYLQLTAGLSGPRLLSTGKEDPNIASDLLTFWPGLFSESQLHHTS